VGFLKLRKATSSSWPRGRSTTRSSAIPRISDTRTSPDTRGHGHVRPRCEPACRSLVWHPAGLPSRRTPHCSSRTVDDWASSSPPNSSRSTTRLPSASSCSTDSAPSNWCYLTSRSFLKPRPTSCSSWRRVTSRAPRITRSSARHETRPTSPTSATGWRGRPRNRPASGLEASCCQSPPNRSGLCCATVSSRCWRVGRHDARDRHGQQQVLHPPPRSNPGARPAAERALAAVPTGKFPPAGPGSVAGHARKARGAG